MFRTALLDSSLFLFITTMDNFPFSPLKNTAKCRTPIRPITQNTQRNETTQNELKPNQNEQSFTRMGPSLALWGVGIGAAVTLFMSPTPIFQKDVLHKIPLVRPCPFSYVQNAEADLRWV
jgi:hypothetical protein